MSDKELAEEQRGDLVGTILYLLRQPPPPRFQKTAVNILALGCSHFFARPSRKYAQARLKDANVQSQARLLPPGLSRHPSRTARYRTAGSWPLSESQPVFGPLSVMAPC